MEQTKSLYDVYKCYMALDPQCIKCYTDVYLLQVAKLREFPHGQLCAIMDEKLWSVILPAT